MPDRFFLPLERSVTPVGVEARCRVPVESDWFSGHFPDNPIFPALGMIGLVDRVLEEGGLTPGAAGPAGRVYKRIRFRQVVRPGDEVFLAVAPQDPGSRDRLRFKIFNASESISEGVIVTNGPLPGMSALGPGHLRIQERAEVPIEVLVPHRDRMRLVDVFEGLDDVRDGFTRSVVRDTWPLCDGEVVNPHVVIELVAQATAAMAGWDDFKGGKGQGFGYIVGIKNACISMDPIPVGARLIMRSRKILTQGNYGVFAGAVYREDRTCGEVVLQVFRPEE